MCKFFAAPFVQRPSLHRRAKNARLKRELTQTERERLTTRRWLPLGVALDRNRKSSDHAAAAEKEGSSSSSKSASAALHDQHHEEFAAAAGGSEEFNVPGGG